MLAGRNPWAWRMVWRRVTSALELPRESGFVNAWVVDASPGVAAVVKV